MFNANLILIARNEDKLKKVVLELDSNHNQKHRYVVADFNEPSILKKKLDDLNANKYPIHILVNNTGGPASGNIINADLLEFEKAFKMHLICNQILVQSVVEGMKKEGFGRIINIISTSVKQPIPGLGVSNTIRGAVASWAKTLASELGTYNITVNNILPGFTETSRLRSIITTRAKQQNKSEEEISSLMKASVPLNRFADASEIANVVGFIVSEAASYVSGINVPVDGGRTQSL